MFPDVLKFRKSLGQDGETADLGASSDIRELWVSLQVKLVPGDALYDATLKYDLVADEFSVQGRSSVQRISLYRGQAECIDQDLRPYCYCRNTPSSSSAY